MGDYKNKIINICLSLATIVLIILLLELGIKMYFAYLEIKICISQENKSYFESMFMKRENYQDTYLLRSPNNNSLYLAQNLRSIVGDGHDSYKIVIVGDSYTAGDNLCDSKKNRYPTLLGNRLGPDFLVMPLAEVGANLDDYLKYSKIYFESYRSNLTVIAFVPNDIDGSIVTQPNKKRRLSEFDGITSKSDFFYFIIKTVERKSGMYERFYIDAYNEKTNLDRLSQDLGTLVDYLRKNNQTVVIAALPFPDSELDENKLYNEEIQFLQEFSHEEDVALIDVKPCFAGRKAKDVILHEFDSHPNKLGHEIISNCIHDNLVKIIT